MSQKTKVAQPNTEHNNVNSSSKIDAIKELIFGENIQAYETEFELVKADVIKKKEELESLIGDVKSELMRTIDSLSTDVNIRITELEDSINEKIETLDGKKADRKLLSDLFIKLGEKIGS